MCTTADQFPLTQNQSLGLMTRTLSHSQAREFYDRFGKRQDDQHWYEDAAIKHLVAHADFEGAGSVFEFGSGTGRMAAQLFKDRLSPSARYLGIDVSRTMVELSQARLEEWRDRARVELTDGALQLPAADGEFDRFLSTYVFDLLSEEDIHLLIAEAHRILSSNGRLCIAGLTHGTGVASRVVSAGWNLVHRLRPALVGGCRPISIARFLSPEAWQVEHQAVETAWGLASEILCATKR